MLYRDDMVGKEIRDKMMELANTFESRYEVAERIMDVGEAHDGIFLQVQWDGLPDKSDWTWRRLDQLN